MSESHAISALRRKRAELSGELIGLEKQRRALAARINHVDEALKLFGFKGDPNDIPARRKRGWMFKRGQLKRMVLVILRESPRALENRDIAAIVVRNMGWDSSDDELQALIAGKVKDVRKRLNRLT